MNLLDTLSANGGVVKQLAGQFGIDSEHAAAAASAIVPALAGAMHDRLSGDDPTNIRELIGGGSLAKFTDDPTSLATPEAAQQGQALLSRLFDTNEVTTLASAVGEKSGLGGVTVRKMLPVVASVLGSLLSKSVASGGELTQVVGQLANAGQGGIIGAVKGLASRVFG